MVKREKLENNTAYMQLQLPSMQTERIGKTLELSQELLNEQKMGRTHTFCLLVQYILFIGTNVKTLLAYV